MTGKNTTLDRKQGLYLKNVGHKGRGVFCVTDIKKGEVLEVTPALVLNDEATVSVEKTVINQYTFKIGKISKAQRRKAGVKSPVKSCAIVHGVMAFCNHDKRPNAEILWEEKGGSLYYYLEATRNIPKNTEICTTYGEGWFKDRK